MVPLAPPTPYPLCEFVQLNYLWWRRKSSPPESNAVVEFSFFHIVNFLYIMCNSFLSICTTVYWINRFKNLFLLHNNRNCNVVDHRLNIELDLLSLFGLLCTAVPQFIDRVFGKTSPIRSFCMIENGAQNYRPCFRVNQPKRSFSIKWKRAFWTGSINSGTGVLGLFSRKLVL